MSSLTAADMACAKMRCSAPRILFARWFWSRGACIYTGDVGKRLGTYRVDRELLAAAAVCAAERGETVTDVIVGGLHAYIRRCRGGEITSAPPVNDSPVYTDREWPGSYDEPPAEPAVNNCKHPADQVEAGECRSCGADVW